MSSSDSFGPEQLRGMIGGPRRRSAEDILSKLGSSGQGRPRHPEPNPRPVEQPSREAPGQEVIGHHDNAIRNHLAGLVRAMLQTGDRAKLRELLVEHRNFIDGILALLDGKSPP